MVPETKRMRKGKNQCWKKKKKKTKKPTSSRTGSLGPQWLWGTQLCSFLLRGQLWVQAMPRGAVGDRNGLCPISKVSWKRAPHYWWTSAAGSPVWWWRTWPSTSHVKSEPQFHVCKWSHQKFFHHRFVVRIKWRNICKTLIACTVMLFKG